MLRHWEDRGLLAPERDSAGRRRYRRDDMVRIAVIQRSKAAGMTLDQVRHLLDAGSSARHEVLAAHVADLDRRMEEMRRSREMTQHALRCRAHDVSTCPRLPRRRRGPARRILSRPSDRRLATIAWCLRPP